MEREQHQHHLEFLKEARRSYEQDAPTSEWVFLDTHVRQSISDDTVAQLDARIERLERMLGVSEAEPEDTVGTEFKRAWDATLDEMARDMWPVTVVNTRAIFKKHGGSIARNTLEKRLRRYRGMLGNEKLLLFIRREIRSYQERHGLFDMLKHLPSILVAGLTAQLCLGCSYIDQLVQRVVNVF